MPVLKLPIPSRLVELALLLLGLSLVLAQPIDPSSSITLSFYTSDGSPLPSTNSSIAVRGYACVQIPSTASSFSSNSSHALLALYQDSMCQSCLYSAETLLTNVDGALSLAWVDLDVVKGHVPGETFADLSLLPDATKVERQARMVQIVLLSLASSIFLIGFGLYLCLLDSRRNQKQKVFVPEPSSSRGHSTLAEVSGPGQLMYQYATPAASTNSPPPYCSEGYGKSASLTYSGMTTLDDAHIEKSSNHTRILSSSRYELPTMPSPSYSNLTNQVGTGAGLDPGSVLQGRNTGFGLGYDPEAYRNQDMRRDCDIALEDAIMTPPHSPKLQPSSVIPDANGQMVGRGGILERVATCRTPNMLLAF